MKHVLIALFLVLNLNLGYAQDEIPSINKMWSRGEGIKNFVFDIEPDSVTFNFSEKDKWSASDIKSYGMVSYNQKNSDGGRLIVRRDSLGIEHFRTIDVMNLTFDSLKLFLHPQHFASAEQAAEAPAKQLKDMKTFFTTEYLYLKKVEEKAPSLKKKDYISFLKEAQIEAKKRAASKMLNLDPKKPIDKRVEEFLFEYAKDKKYRGKIFPATLDRAIKANAKDDNIKKIIAGIKTNFVVKKGTEPEAPKEEKGKTGTKKTEAKTEKDGSVKTKPTNDLIIKTEEKKAK
ncbi:MAG TPA: hypothetical protein PK323_08805 [Bacteroidia bacterium]|nr:hypothetical protein [Bacteroidia bacterium]